MSCSFLAATGTLQSQPLVMTDFLATQGLPCANSRVRDAEEERAREKAEKEEKTERGEIEETDKRERERERKNPKHPPGFSGCFPPQRYQAPCLVFSIAPAMGGFSPAPRGRLKRRILFREVLVPGIFLRRVSCNDPFIPTHCFFLSHLILAYVLYKCCIMACDCTSNPVVLNDVTVIPMISVIIIIILLPLSLQYAHIYIYTYTRSIGLFRTPV